MSEEDKVMFRGKLVSRKSLELFKIMVESLDINSEEDVQ